MAEENTNTKSTGGEKTVQDVIDSMTEEQRTVLYALVGQALEEKEKRRRRQQRNETQCIQR